MSNPSLNNLEQTYFGGNGVDFIFIYFQSHYSSKSILLPIYCVFVLQLLDRFLSFSELSIIIRLCLVSAECFDTSGLLCCGAWVCYCLRTVVLAFLESSGTESISQRENSPRGESYIRPRPDASRCGSDVVMDTGTTWC